LSNADIICF
jgi:mRNA deadenylase 3'-5' endonuclease subunit Ccr4